MARPSLRIVNESSRQSETAERAIDAMEKALSVQLRHLAKAWGTYVWQVVDDANEFGFKIVLLDDAEAANELGYHTIDENTGTPYARVFLDPTLEHGNWLRGANSVSVALTHEACEMIGDPTVNHWVEKLDGGLVSQELCDPVQSCAYPVKLGDGRLVSVSNFVYPDWFNPFAQPGATLDHMGVLDEPFEIAPGGYVIRKTPSGVRNEYGKRFARWRLQSKRKPGSRTYVRHALG